MKLSKTQSIISLNDAFSFEDFEEGLMLAGYISPRSLQELAEKEALDLHEANSKQIDKTENLIAEIEGNK